MIPLILALFLAVGQTSSAVSPKASSKTTRTSSVAQGQPTTQKKPSAQSPAAVEAQATGENQSPSHKGGDKNTKQPIRISELPPVAVKRDWLDYVTPLLTFLLVLVGAIAASVGVLTIRSINRQALVMRRQTEATERAARATERSVALAADTAQRQLRAYVCVPSAMLKFYSTVLFEAQVHAQNKGQTPAYDLDHRINIWIGDRETKFSDLPQPSNLGINSSSAILGPGQETILVRQEDGSTKAPLGHSNSTIFVYGIIMYTDAFKIDRYTRFCHVFGGINGGRIITKNGQQVGLLQTHSEGNDAN